MRYALATAALAGALMLCAAASVEAQTGPTPAAPGAACQAPKRYIALVNGGHYDQLGQLFAADAVFLAPNGKTLRGRDEIAAFYRRFLPQMKPRVRAVSFIHQGRECMVELALATKFDDYAHYVLGAVDHFTVDSRGQVSRMIVYLRPAGMALTSKAEALSSAHP